jgi:hypothetical protein
VKKRLYSFIKNISISLFIFTSLFLFDINISNASDPVQVRLNVSVCNLNNICEDVIGEDSYNCPEDCGAPPLPGGGGSSTSVNPPPAIFPDNTIKELVTLPSFDSANIKWKTDYPSVLVLKWGKTPDYETGSLAESWYHSNFDVNISGLEANTRYYFNIELIDTLYRKISYSGFFDTLSVVDNSKPFPPLDLKAYIKQKSILLNWNVIADQNFSNVRLVKSDIFYPLDHTNGKVVYEGSGQHMEDFDMIPGKLYFYSLFVKNKNGKYSDPVIIAVLFPKKIDQKPEHETDKSDKPIGDDGKTISSKPAVYDPLLKDNDPIQIPDFSDSVYNRTLCNTADGFYRKDLSVFDQSNFIIIQDDKRINLDRYKYENSIKINPDSHLYIQIKPDKNVPGDIRAMAFCINHRIPEVRKSYLFTYNTEKKVFEVQIPTFFSTNDFEFYIGMLRYRGNETVLGSGEFITKEKTFSDGMGMSENQTKFLGPIKKNIDLIILVLIFIFIIIWKRASLITKV